MSGDAVLDALQSAASAPTPSGDGYTDSSGQYHLTIPTGSGKPQAANDPVLSALQDVASGKYVPPPATPVGKVAKPLDDAPQSEQNFAGALEAGAHAATGAFGGFVGGAAALGTTAGDMIKRGELIPSQQTSADALQKAHDIASEFTYEPRTATGQAITGAVSGALAHRMPGQTTLGDEINTRPDLAQLGGAILPAVTPFLGGAPSIAGAAEVAPLEAGAAAGTVPGAVQRTAGTGVAPLSGSQYASGGSAATTAGSAIAAQGVSPQLLQGLRQNAKIAAEQQIPFNYPAAAAHIEADKLGVQISEGQATGDSALISQELNERKELGTEPRFQAQNDAMGKVFDSVRESAGPDVYASEPGQLGQLLLDAKKQEALADKANVGQKYQALQDAAKQANLPNMGIDTNRMFQGIDSNLADKFLTDHVPDPIAKTLDRIRDGAPITVEGYESLRTQLAEAQRGGGSAAAAAGVIRDQLEAMPLAEGAAKLKGLADNARQAAAKVFAKQDPRRLNTYDPAYADASSDLATPVDTPSPLAQNFIRDHVVGANPVYLDRTLANLNDAATRGLIDPAVVDHARQTAAVGMLESLRTAAKMGEGQTGSFAANNFNSSLRAASPKLGSVFSPEDAETLAALGRTSQRIAYRPKGNWVNTSGTSVDMRPALNGAVRGALGAGARYLAAGADTAVPFAQLGTRAVNWYDDLANQNSINARIMKSWGPGAGTLSRPQ